MLPNDTVLKKLCTITKLQIEQITTISCSTLVEQKTSQLKLKLNFH